jgi:hypothetical protein
MLAHVTTDGSTSIACPRCRALSKEVHLLPVEESLQQVGSPPAESPEKSSSR